ncbi:MAG: AI-2E family transporter [Balneolaceae bacterium]
MPDNESEWYVKYTVILAGIILTVYALTEAETILKPLLFSLFLSILVLPFCNWMERHRIPRILSAVIAIICGLVLIGGILTFFYAQFASFTEDVSGLQDRFEELLGNIQEFLSTRLGFEGYIDFDSVKETIYQYLRENTDALTERLAEAISVATSIVLVPVYMFLILMFRDFLREFVLRIFGQKSEYHQKKAKTIMYSVKNVTQGYITGIFIVMVILSVMYSAMLYIIGLQNALFFGVFAGLLSIIPVLGPLMGSVVPIIYALLTTDSLFYPLIIMAGFYVGELLEGNFITPVIVGNQVSLNALVALVLLFIGAQIWGLAGMILIIPLGAILKVVFDEVETLEPFGYLMGRVPANKLNLGKWEKKISSFMSDRDK